MSTTPSGIATRGLLLLAVLHAARHDHPDVLEMLTKDLVEMVRDLLRLPSVVAPHPRDLLRVLKDRVRVVGAAEDLAVDVTRAFGRQERDERRVESGVLLRRRLLTCPLEQARRHARPPATW